jgi:hypothetical protein
MQIYPRQGNGRRSRLAYWLLVSVQLAAPEGFSICSADLACTVSRIAGSLMQIYSFPSLPIIRRSNGAIIPQRNRPVNQVLHPALSQECQPVAPLWLDATGYT